MTTAVLAPRRLDRLPAWSLYAAVLSGAGLPIYIYAPKFYADEYGVGLAALGTMLFALRLIDVVQDPALGWISERLGPRRPAAMAAGAALLAISMIALFAIPPAFDPLLWFALSITGLFTAFSFLTINFYAEGITKAGADGQVRLAAWRESGALTGICIAAVAPTALVAVTGAPYAAFAFGFATVTLLAASLMWSEWGRRMVAAPIGLSGILSDPTARRLLLLAFLNAIPLAVSSTLFLFFVESRLGAPGWEGPLLLLFFLAAALSSPVWSRLAQAHGVRPVLLAAMVLAIATFGGTLFLGTGDVWPFAAICVLSGAAIGADLTLLPALFARRMSKVAPNGGQGFGLWSLMNKLSLAFAAVLLLPLLEGAGFVAGRADQPAEALELLTLLYAGIPSVLKFLAIALLALTRLEDVT